MKNIYFLLFSQLLFSQLQVNSFYPSSGASGISFGNKVDLNNNEVIVSSTTQPTPTPTQIGKVYVFSINNNTFNQTDTLLESDVTINDLFGNSLSIENQNIAIGAAYQGLNFSKKGAVYLYKKVNSNYQFVQKITSINNTVDDKFGSFVKIFNHRLYISSSNSVYIFDLNGSNWTLTQTISIPGTIGFGTKIEVDDTKLIITSSTNYSIHNYISIANSNQWIFQNSMVLGLNESDYGIDFKLFNSQLYVVKNSSKQVVIYDNIQNYWELNSSFNFFQGDQVYDTIVVNDENIFLGSNGYILQMTRKFPIFHFKKVGNVWTTQPSFQSNEINSQVDDFFGSSMALQGSNLIIGCPGERNGNVFLTGKAYYADTTLGIDENFLNSFYFYPNPTKDYLYLNNEHLDEINSISIFQIDGKMVSNSITNFEKIDLRNFNIGVYFMKIQFKNNIIITKKIVKN